MEHIELIVRTSSGSVDTSLKIPVDATAEQREALVKLWVDSLITILKMIPIDKKSEI